MSAGNTSPAPKDAHAPARQASVDHVVRGPEDALGRPAGEFLANVPWAGVAPDPDVLVAADFLALL